MPRRSTVMAVAGTLVAAVAAWRLWPAPAPSPAPLVFFAPSAGRSPDGFRHRPGSAEKAYAREVRARRLDAGPGLLPTLFALGLRTSIAVELGLFEDARFRLSLARIPPASAGWAAWAGTGGGADVVVVGRTTDASSPDAPAWVSGVVRSADGRVFSLQRFPGAPEFYVNEVEPLDATRCARAAPRVTAPWPGLPLEAREDPQTIDVLVAYTTAALDLVGLVEVGPNASEAASLAALEAHAEQGLTQMNWALEQSGLAHVHVRRAGLHRVPDDGGGGWQQILDRLEAGALPGVHAARTRVAADLVCLLIGEPQDADVSGIANTMTVPTVDSWTRAFAVVAIGATGAWGDTFPHELGHLLGCCHDPDHWDGACLSLHDFRAHPKRFHAALASDPLHPVARMTLMGEYGRTETEPRPRRILRFSNPRILWDGNDGGLGGPGGEVVLNSESTGGLTEDKLLADNASVIRRHAAFVAAFLPRPN